MIVLATMYAACSALLLLLHLLLVGIGRIYEGERANVALLVALLDDLLLMLGATWGNRTQHQ